MGDREWQRWNGYNPCELLIWLYDHPGGLLKDFVLEQRTAHIDQVDPVAASYDVRLYAPPYDEFNWDRGLEELRNAGLITGEGWEDDLQDDGIELDERLYPMIVDRYRVELTATGRAWVEEHCAGYR